MKSGTYTELGDPITDIYTKSDFGGANSGAEKNFYSKHATNKIRWLVSRITNVHVF